MEIDSIQQNCFFVLPLGVDSGLTCVSYPSLPSALSMNNLSSVTHVQELDKKARLEVSAVILKLLDDSLKVLCASCERKRSHMHQIFNVTVFFGVLWFFFCIRLMYSLMSCILCLSPTIQIRSFASVFKGWLSK